MLTIIRTDSGNKDFVELVKQLDAYLAITDGDDHAFYDQYNKLDTINHVLVAYLNDRPIACGAFKKFAEKKAEIKRMYTTTDMRGQGIAGQILAALEKWAQEVGYSECILETGINQHAAIALYKKENYTRTANYGQYAGIEGSLCFSKKLKK